MSGSEGEGIAEERGHGLGYRCLSKRSRDMGLKQLAVFVVTTLAVLGWMGLATSGVAGPSSAPASVHVGPGVSPPSAAPSPPAAAASPSPAESQNPEANLVSHALAATRAAGLNPDVAYVPRPSATPAQVAEAAEKGSAAPLYTGDPAPMGLADYGLGVTGELFVANWLGDNVTVISGVTNTAVASITVGLGPIAVAYDSGNGELYVANQRSDNVSVINGATNAVVAWIPAGTDPWAVAYDSGNGEVYVANDGSGNVSVINGATNTVVATIFLGTDPYGMAYDSGNGEVYVANLAEDNVSVICDGSPSCGGSTYMNKVVAAISVGTNPRTVGYDSGNGELYVPNYGSDDVSVICDGSTSCGGSTYLNKVIDTVPVGSEPAGATYDSGNGEVYVPNLNSQSVSVICDGSTSCGGSPSLNKVVATVTVGDHPSTVAYDSGNGEVYVTNVVSDDVSVIIGETNAVVATVPVGNGPWGIAYYIGMAPSILNTTSLQGYVDASATGIQGEDLYQSIPDGFSIQMNAVLTNITLFGTPGYEFWAQDIVTYFPATGYMILVTNIWNYSAPGAPVSANAINSHGPYGHDDYATLGYYYANYTVPYPVSYPFNVTLSMTSSLASDGTNQNYVGFSADVSSPTDAFTEVSMSNYDYVVFNSYSYVTEEGASQPSNFTASGVGYNPAHLLDDFELVICGPGGGSQVNLGTADATLALRYITGGNWSAIPSAYNYGSDTGETSIGANVAWSWTVAGSPNGTIPYGTMTTGPSVLSGLWGTGAPEGSYPIQVSVFSEPTFAQLGNAFNFFLYNGSAGFSAPIVSQYEYAPTMEASVFNLMPGTYEVRTELAGYTDAYNVLTVPKEQGLNVTLTTDPTLGVYTPLWAFSNAEVAAIAQSGMGTPTDPYVLYNNQSGPLSSDFGLYNDYAFPVFPGVFLKDTNVSVELNNSSTFETYTNDFQPSPGQFLPPTNELQFWFWNVTGVALVNDTNITGWFGLQGYFPLTFNTFNVVFYASEHNLVANNRFLTQSQGLLMYSNGTLYGTPGSTGGNNTVWGNEIVQVTPPLGCPGPAACLPLLPYNSGLGLEIGEGYDLIYDNLFETPTTAWLLPLNLYTELPYLWSHDVWNIANQSASVIHFAAGFPTIPLGGSVVGGPVQGGNSWWDYGIAQNFANGADNPIGVLPYDENASSLISPASGFGTPLPGYPCPEYYCATYIYSGGDYVPLPPIAAEVTVSPQGLVNSTQWGAVISCQPAKSGGAGPAKSGGAGPAKSGGAGPCSGTGGGADPPPIVLAAFQTTVTSITLVLPDGAYNWTPIVPSGYTSNLGGSFVVTASAPVALNVPYAPPTEAVLTYAEQGLPPGLNWQVAVGGKPMSLTTDGATDSLSFIETSGASYPYTISGVPGWQQSTLPLSGTVVVTAAPTIEPTLVYGQVTYPVTFSESGLPSGLPWTVTFNAVPKGLTTNGGTDTLTFTAEPNGTYSYSIAGDAGYHESTIPYAGTETVNGVPLAVGVSYSPVTYGATFSESGLPSGITWQVTFAGVLSSLTTNGGTDTLAFASEPNGTYSYSIAGNAGYHENTIPYTGTETVSGAPLAVSVAYFRVTYPVSFSESGLPPGLTWKVTFAGVTLSLATNGGTDTLTFAAEPNGTYTYSITANAGYHESTIPYTGTESVNGAPLSVSVTYTQVTYSVTFLELGLPAGLTWKVTVNGVTKSLTTNGILDWLTWTGLANGTYTYSITDNPGWHEFTLPYSGKITVNGASVYEVLIYLLVTYHVTFSESGLPSGLTWTVTVNGVTKHLKTDGGTDSLTWFGLVNGTYSYSIAAVSGWHQSTLPPSGNVVVSGASVAEPTLRYTH
jgi:thermopsin